MISQIAQTSQGPVEYTLLGDGPVLLVCHGTSSDCFSTELAAPLVEAGFSVLTPSRPGYGRTPLDTGRNVVEAAHPRQQAGQVGLQAVEKFNPDLHWQAGDKGNWPTVAQELPDGVPGGLCVSWARSWRI